uniref:SH2 domain-containing protein n=1 Tax=Pristionchus pacificus TaxID=54126 RepID=A0A8R1UUN7_PRIPA
MQFGRDMARDALKTIIDKFRFVPSSRPPPSRMTTVMTRRSRSAGDLEGPQYELIQPGPANGGHVEKGEGLPPHPDDSDRVPVEFLSKENKDGARMRILNPHSFAAKETKKRGEDTEVPPEMLHVTQPWFYPDMGRDKAESILARLGLMDGSFLVREFSSHMALSMAHGERVCHFLIHNYIDPSTKDIRYFIESDHTHTSIYGLVKYYRIHKGNLLPVTLGCAASRVLYYRSEEAVRKHRLNTERRAVRAVTSNGGIKGESASRPRLSLF